MAIKINKGTAPALGRLTMPQGTFLSDQPPFQPTTALDGAFGEGGAMLPKAPQIPVGGTPSPLQPSQPAGSIPTNPIGQFTQWLDQAMRDTPTMPELATRFNYDEAKTRWGPTLANMMQSYANLVSPTGGPTGVLNEPTHSLVGNDIGASPIGLSLQQVTNLFPSLSQKQIRETMMGMGYTYQYSGGRGGVWVKTGEGTGTALPSSGSQNLSSQGAPLDPRGRPQWVDPTALQRGERVTTQSGTTFVGGTPTASGQAQYAVTIPGGVDDERYKWAEKTRQDNDGNWVKVYSRVKRAQYTRQWRKKQQGRAEEAAQQQAAVQQVEQPQSMTVQPPVGFNQLVNLRADYG